MTLVEMNFERALMTVTAIFAVSLALFAAQPWPIAALPSAVSVDGNEVREDRAFERIAFQDSTGATTDLNAMNGHVRLVTMFYTHCPGLCPATVESLRRIESLLSPTERRRLRVVMLSLDPRRDSSEALAAFGTARELDTQRWIVGRSSAADLPALAKGLGTHYRTVPDGSIDHENPVVLLGADGRILARWNQKRGPDADFLKTLRVAMAAG